MVRQRTVQVASEMCSVQKKVSLIIFRDLNEILNGGRDPEPFLNWPIC